MAVSGIPRLLLRPSIQPDKDLWFSIAPRNPAKAGLRHLEIRLAPKRLQKIIDHKKRYALLLIKRRKTILPFGILILLTAKISLIKRPQAILTTDRVRIERL